MHTSLTDSSPGKCLIPKPGHIEMQPGHFTITPATNVLYSGDDARVADAAAYLASRLSKAFARKVTSRPAGSDKGRPNTIVLTTDQADAELAEEGYALTVSEDSVVIRAPHAGGAFWGGITLLQLAPVEAFRDAITTEEKSADADNRADHWNEPNLSKAKPVDSLRVPCGTVRDKPRFSWRGLLVDPARDFWTIDQLKRYIDTMVMHKLNVLHIHLTDDQAWLPEIKKYPELGGRYTRKQLRDLVAYAGKRFVNIVPEIEMPGHAGTFLRAMPQCNCTHRSDHDLCPGKELTYRVMQDILDEIIEVFPSKYIHIGADEVSKTGWRQCGDCRDRVASEKLENVDELHGYFVNRISEHVATRGRTVVWWGDVTYSVKKTDAAAMYWLGPYPDTPDWDDHLPNLVKRLSGNGQRMIMSPTTHVYFDYVQSPEKASEPQAHHIYVNTLRRVYEMDPEPECVAQIDYPMVLGVHGCVWGTWLKSFPHLLYMTYPRACALSEVAWSEDTDRRYDAFHDRLLVHLKRLDAAGVKYRMPTDIDRPSVRSYKSGKGVVHYRKEAT